MTVLKEVLYSEEVNNIAEIQNAWKLESIVKRQKVPMNGSVKGKSCRYWT